MRTVSTCSSFSDADDEKADDDLAVVRGATTTSPVRVGETTRAARGTGMTAVDSAAAPDFVLYGGGATVTGSSTRNMKGTDGGCQLRATRALRGARGVTRFERTLAS